MPDNRAIAIYNRLASKQARLVQTQARMIAVANAVFATGPVGAQKALELIDSATGVLTLNSNLIATMNSILAKRAESEALLIALESSNLSGNVPRQTVIEQFGDQIAVIDAQMADFVALRDIARQSSTQITALAHQSKLSSDSAYAVGSITGIVGVVPLPPPGGPPPPPVIPPVITPAPPPPVTPPPVVPPVIPPVVPPVPPVAPPPKPPPAPPRGPRIILE